MFNLSIKARSLVISSSFVGCVLVLGGAGIWGLNALERVISDTARAGTALGNQTESDMMHDGMRADVLYARQIALEGMDPERVSEVLADIKDHGENFESKVDDNLKLGLPTEVHAKIQALLPHIKAYHEATRDTARAAD